MPALQAHFPWLSAGVGPESVSRGSEAFPSVRVHEAADTSSVLLEPVLSPGLHTRSVPDQPCFPFLSGSSSILLRVCKIFV